ncbi:hypothetical protein RVR_8885 [Actinacidiphila reveromycinica]|uniref:SnoaL-like domain-containing protein n=1 Tax=Actinacidiphila reveromycinica TaxID=659352 RepID=A0A7U3UZ12_9ACTN|nr:nuclear transport factor 2 family protein [Streptomyces sp. SN-593]BBB01457.1 hypothetical protein RVR_8885 [Streptomyces sp. SN-593]
MSDRASAPVAASAPPSRAVAALLDRSEISGLLDRYLLDFDGLSSSEPRQDTWYGTLFTPDLDLEFPVSGHQGLAGLAEFQRAAKAHWARTHHTSTNHVVDLDGDTAELAAGLLVTHVHPPESGRADLRTGSRITARAVRTPDGWRLRALAIRLVWSRGDLPPRPGRP